MAGRCFQQLLKNPSFRLTGGSLRPPTPRPIENIHKISPTPNREIPCHLGFVPKSPHHTRQRRGPGRVLAIMFSPRAHASQSSIRKLLFCRRLLAKPKGTPHPVHAKSRFQTIKLSLRFLRFTIGTRITGASQAAVVSTTEAGAFRSEAAGHSAI